MHEGEFVRGELLPRILELDKHLPSPYTMGLLDEFFDDKLTPDDPDVARVPVLVHVLPRRHPRT